jgi:hypothetical protein
VFIRVLSAAQMIFRLRLRSAQQPILFRYAVLTVGIRASTAGIAGKPVYGVA